VVEQKVGIGESGGKSRDDWPRKKKRGQVVQPGLQKRGVKGESSKYRIT